MDSLKIAKPSNVFLSLIFPCARGYAEKFDDLFYDRITRAVKLSRDDHRTNNNELDEALKAAVRMKNKEEVRLYLIMEDDAGIITTEIMNHLLQKLNELDNPSKESKAIDSEQPPIVTVLKPGKLRIFKDED